MTIKKCAVIGSGIGGLAVAIRLANKGYRVTVFESNAQAGGKMSELHANGYRFDKGPSVLTKPEYLDDLFVLSGKNPRDYLQFEKVDPVFKYFFKDGTVINSTSDRKRFAEEIASKTEATEDSVIDFLEKAEIKHSLTDEVFLQRSLHKPFNYFNRSTVRGIFNFGKIEAFTTMNRVNQKQFNDAKVVDIFNRYASYNGSDPYQAPATLNVISHYEITLGTYYPTGGIYSIINALVELAEEVGVKFRFNTKVSGIAVNGNKATGIETDAGSKQFDLVVSNSDIYNTCHKLLPNSRKPNRSLNQPKSSSVIVFYWGMKRQFPKLGLHNMFLSDDSETEYKHIFQQGSLSDDPTVHLTISSKRKASDAPEGRENWAALISTPHDTGQDWDTLIDQSRERVIKKISSILGEDIALFIEFESVLDPRMVQTETSSAFGAVFGNSSNSKFSAFLRHPNFSSRIDNLFFCGGSVHPGAGVPLCLLSAKIVSDLISKP
ncbi:MAG: phytoene desaturase family protein [Flavobacteriales bacterium]|nr:phytoene desaturase family protein [Flavobacteriales bacterium]